MHTNVHKGLGLNGALTSGVMRDLDDLVHADRHGGLVVPPEVIPHLKAAIETMFAGEQIILGAARQPDFDLDKLLEARAKFEKART